MKKQLIIHFIFLVAYFLLISVYKGWFNVNYVVFWVGGVLGTLLPYLDHLIYVYLLKPNEQVSQNANQMLNQKNLKGAFGYLVSDQAKKTKHIFHTAYFQVIFILLTFLVITSSGSAFGRGIVLAFMLHLLIAQVMDFMETKTINNWFEKLSITLDRERQLWYLGANMLLVIIFGLFF